MRAVVLLGLFEQHGAAKHAVIEQLLQPDVLGREAQLFRVHQLDAGLIARRDHAIRVRQVQAQRFLDDHMLAGLRSLHRDLAVSEVGCADHDHVDLVHGEHRVQVLEVVRDAML